MRSAARLRGRPAATRRKSASCGPVVVRVSSVLPARSAPSSHMREAPSRSSRSRRASRSRRTVTNHDRAGASATPQPPMSARSVERTLVCTPRALPRALWEDAARTAIGVNPVNRPAVDRALALAPALSNREAIAALTTKYWHNADGVKLTVGFVDDAPADLRKRLVVHMNAWGKTANVKFVQSKSDRQVRFAREGGPDGGYWSYLGTDILHIASDQQTMNLEAFTMSTPGSEFHRVVRHETGHTLGFPHEHMRKQLVSKIDVAKATAYFKKTQGWSAQETRNQVLTPLEESTIRGTAVDPKSIMCYHLPGAITKDGK